MNACVCVYTPGHSDLGSKEPSCCRGKCTDSHCPTKTLSVRGDIWPDQPDVPAFGCFRISQWAPCGTGVTNSRAKLRCHFVWLPQSVVAWSCQYLVAVTVPCKSVFRSGNPDMGPDQSGQMRLGFSPSFQTSHCIYALPKRKEGSLIGETHRVLRGCFRATAAGSHGPTAIPSLRRRFPFGFCRWRRV